MIVTTRTNEHKFRSMNWRRTWFIGFHYLMALDVYLIGFLGWGFLLKRETLWKLKGRIHEARRKSINRRVTSRAFRRNMYRAIYGPDESKWPEHP